MVCSKKRKGEMAALTDWVCDRLHELLGLADKYTADFLIGTAKKCNSEDIFLKKLKETGALKMNDSVVSFASELWSKVPHKKVEKYAATREKEKAALLQHQKNKTYSLVSDEEDDMDTPSRQRAKKKEKGGGKKEKASKRRRNIRKEKASTWESESEEDPDESAKKTKVDSDSDEWERLVYLSKIQVSQGGVEEEKTHIC